MLLRRWACFFGENICCSATIPTHSPVAHSKLMNSNKQNCVSTRQEFSNETQSLEISNPDHRHPDTHTHSHTHRFDTSFWFAASWNSTHEIMVKHPPSTIDANRLTITLDTRPLCDLSVGCYVLIPNPCWRTEFSPSKFSRNLINLFANGNSNSTTQTPDSSLTNDFKIWKRRLRAH